MWEQITKTAADKGIVLPQNAASKFFAYYEILVRENKKLNLTRITAEKEVAYKHFLDSLELLAWSPQPTGRVIDVGSGAGMPGLPLKIAIPSLQLTLLDSSGKRVDFLSRAVAELSLEGVEALHGRAEDIARQPGYREKYQWVVSRAVARLAVLCELCLPLVAIDGYFVAYKGPDVHNEITEAANALRLLGGRVEEVRPYILPEEMGERALIIIKKVNNTADKYPRKAGLPEKRPL